MARLGLAVVGREGRTSALVWADTIRTPSNQDESARLLHLVTAMRAAIAQHEPTCVAIERVAFSRNRSSALTVARVTGAVMVVAAEAGLPVAEYSPTQVKSAVTGIGNADKDQVGTALIRVHAMVPGAGPTRRGRRPRGGPHPSDPRAGCARPPPPISFLEGEVVEKGANRIVLAVGGVGYDLLVPTSAVRQQSPTGTTMRVCTRVVLPVGGSLLTTDVGTSRS